MPQRSRGCQECRKRRVGCDRTLPICRQCRLTNRDCSGAVEGAIIIEQTAKTMYRSHQKSVRLGERTSVMNIQPSPNAIVSLALVSNFISFVTSLTDVASRPGFLQRLGALPVDDKGPALDLAMQAAAWAYCGVESRNHAAVMESCRIYGEALSLHSTAISRRSYSSDPSLIYTSVILSLFEAVWSTNIAAYGTHLTAARNMLGSVGLEHCQNQLLKQIAMHVQYQTLFTMVVSPFDHFGPDTRLDIGTSGFTFPSEESLDVADQLTAQIYNLWKLVDADECKVDMGLLELHLHDIGSNIAKIWGGYEEDAASRGEAIQYDWKGTLAYRDTSTALTTAYFATTQVMMSLADTLGPKRSSQTNKQHCRGILSCARYLLRWRKALGCAGLAMLLPLTLVALYSTSSECRRMAYSYLNKEFEGAAFAGLRSIAVGRIRKFGKIDTMHQKKRVTLCWKPANKKLTETIGVTQD